MQPLNQLAYILASLADREHYLFAICDLQAILPDKSSTSFRALIGRAEKNGLLKRVCRGLYLYPKVDFPAGLILYHAAARLRAAEFNYISLETALSDAGIISQIPMNWITLMSSGRSYTVDCGSFGHIEFVHTKKNLDKVVMELKYDPVCRLWRASASLALRDMALTRRNTDLIDWETANELVR
jgi:hypothetical protein